MNENQKANAGVILGFLLTICCVFLLWRLDYVAERVITLEKKVEVLQNER